MSKRRKILLAGLSLLLFYLFLTKPGENVFIEKIAHDYGQVHGGVSLPPHALLQMGTSQYRSYLIYSQYTYRFGNIEVYYLGVGPFTFQTGSRLKRGERRTAPDVIES
jgi:hypothetical protein